MAAKVFSKHALLKKSQEKTEKEDEEQEYNEFLRFLAEDNMEDFFNIENMDPIANVNSPKRKTIPMWDNRKEGVTPKRLKPLLSQPEPPVVSKPTVSKKEPLSLAPDDILEALLAEKPRASNKKFEPIRSLPTMKLPPPIYSHLPTPFPSIPPPSTVIKPQRSRWGEDFEQAEPEPLRKSLTRSPSPTEPLPMPVPSAAVYNCPVCQRDNLTESDLVRHVAKKHVQVAANLPCPICEITYGDSHAAKVKDLRVHLETQHGKTSTVNPSAPVAPPRIFSSAVPPGIVPPIPRARHELITRGSQPAIPLYGLGRGLSGLRLSGGHKLDLADQLWEFVVGLDLDEELSTRVGCNLCYDLLQAHQTQAILTCDHTFHADCLSTDRCPLCTEAEEEKNAETTEKKKKKKKKKKSKKKKKPIAERDD